MSKTETGRIRMDRSNDVPKQYLTRIRNYSQTIASLADICDCARTLKEWNGIVHKIWTDGECTIYKTELEANDNQDLWDWYHNQRGGSCNG